MRQRSRQGPAAPARRRLLKRTAALGALAVGAPYVLRSAHAQANADTAPYAQAKINWRQAEGEEIAVAVIPASYFDNQIAIAPTFEALSGVKVRFEKVPPGQIRQKAMLDLSSKTATYATSATDPMYYPLYVSNKWVDPLDRYLGDSALTDAA
jgi:ABC-type glycerol-3-phosphate transport system substrate-binding protein